MSRRIDYVEGLCFFVPLRTGGFARGIVSRMNGKGQVFGYFFGPKLMVAADRFSGVSPRVAILGGFFGDLGLLNKKWPHANVLLNWCRNDWNIPPMYREDQTAGKAWLSYYDDTTMAFISEVSTATGNRDPRFYDRVMGYGAVEIRLTKLLSE